jgi:hypothetical protein
MEGSSMKEKSRSKSRNMSDSPRERAPFSPFVPEETDSSHPGSVVPDVHEKLSMSSKPESLIFSEPKQSDSKWRYRIDDKDIITGYSDNLLSFARDNDWSSEIKPEEVIGHSIFEFIDGLETRYLYKQLFKKVREENRIIGPIPFRCDSPTERRLLELTLYPLPNDHINITSILVKSEPREEVRTLKIEVPRSEKIVTICSMCKKIALPSGRWVEIEEGLASLGIFEEEEVPQLSHGLCPECFNNAMEEIGDEPFHKST